MAARDLRSRMLGFLPMARVLVIEDEPAIAESLAYSLRREGYGVDIAASIAEAEDKVEGVDLCILDLMLPDGSGFDLLVELRRRDHPPAVIILSSREPCCAAPASSVLRNPKRPNCH
jgi:CheY-like chemotaxis protein